MLKISHIDSMNQAIALKLEGRLVGPWVSELQKSCDEVLTGKNGLELHLSEVEFIDSHGAALLASLRRRGVALLQCPPFAAEQLKTWGKNAVAD